MEGNDDGIGGKLARKLSLGIALILVLNSLVLIAVSHYLSKKNLLLDSQDKLMAVAAAAALQIDGDTYQKFRTADDTNTLEYRRMLAFLREIQGKTGVDYVYTFAWHNGQLVFILDADPENPAQFGEVYDCADDLTPVLKGQPTASKRFYADKWGTLISGYAPIFNSKGAVVGILGVDENVQDFMAMLRKRSVYMGLASLMVLLAGLALSMVVIRKVVGPITLVAEKLGEMTAIAANVSSVAQNIERITSHIQEQRESTQQVLEAVESIAGVAQELACMCQELSASVDFQHSQTEIVWKETEGLLTIASELQVLVGRFKWRDEE